MCVCFCIYRIFPCGANGQVIFCWCSWRVTEITRVHWHHENIDAFKYIFTCINISSICSQLTPIIEMAQLLTLQFFAIWFHLQAAKVDWRWWTMALQRRIALKSLPNSESNWWKTSRIGFEKMYLKKNGISGFLTWMVCEFLCLATLLGFSGALEHERFSRHKIWKLLGGCVDNGVATMVRAQSPLESDSLVG